MTYFAHEPATSWETTVLLRRESGRTYRSIKAVTAPGEITALFTRKTAEESTPTPGEERSQQIALLSALRQWQHEWE